MDIKKAWDAIRSGKPIKRDVWERIVDLLPPLAQPGDSVRQGTQCPMNLYLCKPGEEKGKPMGTMRSPELAQLVRVAMNRLLGVEE